MKFKRRMAQVCDVIDLSKHMRRIVVTGDELADIPSGLESAHVKVIFPTPGESKPKLSFDLGLKKRMRSYTIRYFDAKTRQLTMDFAVNDHVGLATQWASQAKVGDFIGIAGPGEIKHTDFFADWHLIIADLTALPAAAATIEKLPKEATGHAFIQVPSSQDIQDILCPEHLNIHWVINGDLQDNALLKRVTEMTWQNGVPAIFIAAGSKHTKAIRQFVLTKPNTAKEKIYASGYWNS